jgi:hypothetical protein
MVGKQTDGRQTQKQLSAMDEVTGCWMPHEQAANVTAVTAAYTARVQTVLLCVCVAGWATYLPQTVPHLTLP